MDLAVDRQTVQSVTALRLFAFDKQHNTSPSSSLDFGFREAMSSFNSNERPTLLASQSAENIAAASKQNITLSDDQNIRLLGASKQP